MSHVPAELANDGEEDDVLPQDGVGDDRGRLQFLVALDECRSQRRVLQQSSCVDCVYYLEQSGRFDLASIAPNPRGSPLPSVEFDISGSVQSLEDEWRAAYSERHERSKQRLLAVSQPTALALHLGGEAQAMVRIGEPLTEPAADGFRLSVPVLPIVANLGLSHSAVRPRQSLIQSLTNSI